MLEKEKLEQAPTRKGYGEGLLAAGELNEKIVALCADLTESTQMHLFAKKFPQRFIEMGVAEQNLATIAAGLANYGKIPFISSYAMFSPGRNWEQIRTTICYNDVPVKIAGSHAGVSVGPDGATHQAVEDIAIMRPIPNMTVINPCDTNEAKKATMAAALVNGPVYLRFAREKTPVFTTLDTPFEVGKAEIFWDSLIEVRLQSALDVAIIACGPLVHNAILATADLEKEGIKIRVINNHTIKPMDEKTIIQAAKDSGAVVTVEEHQVQGGMGSAVAEVLAKNYPVPIEFVGVQNRFGESGTPNELIEHFGMGVSHIKEAVKKVLKRKIK
ncbi:transketolase [Candidatus Giovannonibacteria bacterium RIFCSPLOWO2_12_FULL_44_25]|uniref:Transketolase n=1 Tax=Candidatus Giovannonibacteria bacterium RIFCSPHIGHO2_02_FULL_45_40 TaxID=1798337 RepID=A0A1F5WB70_9BACT|nr:MAG: transketolase [Candidatus Giovannonibacteria bacterium GWA2_45_15]OGF60622.1 MAG: transketolase [Candidatus Giovannonibacteria bacterium RIFCSPHIGHO2_01_FULL_44_100]OGF60711.1 MAG: transketolase [Candidatus Giovannonibacteria bacterium RIFCSPHIGHO2_01_45_12]OGF72899.1 MAG: transketolase [Candidatus Giovannonibacteria bacterium RIFCSPHIGHO2_02_FULL_45_40]OGF84177.1 MAG: transketolase [Candidatus Giovannonibacteria bacterium RIFCSPHIGHO2_12_FULL_45_19]OGF85248.1 MAG: transketolase [Candi